ncbi:hypothetical protein TSOC_008461 [Tetrabaena socialis]|uniref:Uncharacterized protein n=1 Tax=Tetrabaena socialis TaxID=47790 RepID=A0A2J7ZYD8_9CHLO|nr:hypothetical protein TSOC_008461 [Tetrabaena socialis]|eukprot:PNH05281.1 hypothetical protein TSOC_008461 [Tetrabaena socialis]
MKMNCVRTALAVLALAAAAAAAPGLLPEAAVPTTPVVPTAKPPMPKMGTAAAALLAATPKPAAAPKPVSRLVVAKAPNATKLPEAPCASPCYTVADYWPYKSCRAECAPEICKKGSGQAWSSREVCCTPGAAFPDGCSVRPESCWVVESEALRTCRRDDRKCLQGYGVWPSKATCCTPGLAFTDGCAAEVAESTTPCWVVDTYFPARLCRSSRTLCAEGSGAQSWASQAACCTKGAAFSEGCSVAPPPTPCFTIGSYWPSRTCVKSGDVAVCNRGWGVYASQEVCCAPAVAFPEGCSAPAAPAIRGSRKL